MDEKKRMLKEELIAYFNNPKYNTKKYRYRDIKKEMCAKRGYKNDLLMEALQELIISGDVYLDERKNLYRSLH